MYRRTMLLLCAGVVGGCMDANGGGARGNTPPRYVLNMMEVTPEEIVKREYRELSDFDDEILNKTIANGTATEIATQPAVHTGPSTRVVHQNTVYEITATVVADAGVIGYEYSVSLTSVDDGASQSAIVAYDALPAVDREKLAAEGFDNEAVTEPTDLGYGFQLQYTPAERNQSALVPQPTQPVIRWQSGVLGRFQTMKNKQIKGKKYQYNVAETTPLQEVGQTIRQTHTISLDNLSEQQHKIITEAINSPHGFIKDVGGTVTATAATQDLFAQFKNNATKMLTNYTSNATKLLQQRVDFLVTYDNTLYLAKVTMPIQ